MNLDRLKFLKTCKTFNSLKPSLMKEIFKIRKTNHITHDMFKLNSDVRRRNHVIFGTKSLTFNGQLHTTKYQNYRKT